MSPRRTALLALLLLSAGCGLIADLPNGHLVSDAGSPGSGGSTGAGAGGAAGGSRYEAEILSDGPAAYWRLDDDGATAADASGNKHDGQYQGATTHEQEGAIAGDEDGAVSFEAIGEARVVAGPILAFEGTAAYTVEAWVKPGSVPSADYQNMIVCGNLHWDDATGGPHNGYMLGVDTGSGTVQARREPGAGWTGAAGADPILAGGARFHHVAMTYSGGEGGVLIVYQDGEILNSSDVTTAIPPHEGEFWIADSDNWVGFTGTLDEVAVYEKALAPDRVKAHYEIGAGVR